MEVRCPECGTPNPADSSFCGLCGARLAVAGEVPTSEEPASEDPAGEEPGTLEGELRAEAELPTAELERSPGEVEPEELPVPEEPPVPQEPPVSPAVEVAEEVPPEGESPELPIEVRVEERAPLEPAAATQEPAVALDAETYYADGDVTITNRGASMGSSLYPLADVRAVSLVTKPANRIPSILLSILGALVAVTALADLFGSWVLGLILAVGGLLLLGIGLFLAATATASYAVHIESASREVDALVSPDRDRVERIVKALNEAMAGMV